MQGIVVVSGLPAAGKSALSARLSADLGWAWVNRDRIGAGLHEDLGDVVPAEQHHRIARAKDRVVNAVIDAALDTGGGAVVDGNFNRIEHAVAVRSLLSTRAVRPIEICLWGDPAVLRQRFIERAAPPLTPDLEPYFERVLNRPRWTVLSPPAPVFQLDSTKLADVDAAYPTLLAAVQTALVDPGQIRRGPCDECGFDWEAPPPVICDAVARLVSTVRARLVPLTADAAVAPLLAVRPEPDVWSVLEYASHLRRVIAFYRERLRQILADDRPILVAAVDDANPSTFSGAGAADVLESCLTEAVAAASLVGRLDQFDWWRVGIGNDGGERSLISLARRMAHECHHHGLDLSRVLTAVGGPRLHADSSPA